jgi:hypothetical protein
MASDGNHTRESNVNIKVSKGILVSGLMALLSACAQQPVAMSSDFWNNKSATVAIVVVKAPEASMHQQGAQGLLDVAISNGASGTLNDHLKTLKFDEFDSISADLQKRLTARGMTVVGVYNEYELPKLPSMSGEGPNHKKMAQQDFRSLAATLKADRLLLITPAAVGTVRSYYGFIPLGAPQGAFIVNAEIVDLKTDELLWYHTATPFTNITDPWDEAPNFPNLTDAVFQAMNASRVDILQQFPPQDSQPLSTVGNK